MGQRVDLQTLLEEVLGSNNVYFQAPANVAMVYPCIVYKRDNAITEFASNSPYRYTKRYMVTYIDRNPDSLVPDKIARLPLCIFNRYFVADGLNHDIFNLYF